MSNLANTLSRRLHARAISLSVIPTQHAVFSKSLNIDALKQRAADWEPMLSLARLKTASKCNDGTDVAHMGMYSTFDPGATHPLLLSSALPMSLAGSMSMDRRSSVRVSLKFQTILIASSLHHNTEVQQSVPVPAVGNLKPWPYSLPRVLRPQVGTTYDLTYGDSAGGGRAGDVMVGVLQKVLYGIPEPDGVGEQNEDAANSLWQKVLHGAQEEGGEEGKAGC
ncbi:uncharacterized protein EKO05_0004195 [Ascochyta rabiei]|uniref:Uncharacterized protein n=1 Tax=Didymella rabiei TaxID=5454 RepID=A0A162XJZ8_DIDRA|nr:uncharacterized protein EKO05_0004195 [Ascochyta rabiei]KZM19590.1 hypothetical protein ST47_g9127 [Ascochyta rabiei]UPX13696.1 hypothetical protein EKO05_0004195 [Ascochyta rabiei]